VVLVAFGALLLSIAPAAQAIHRRAECRPRGTVVTANAVAIVWRRGPRDSHETFVCVWRTGRTRSLGTFDDPGGGTYEFRLGGRYLAYDDQICDHTLGCSGGIKVVDLVKRRVLRDSVAPPDGGIVTALVLNRNGSAAWIRSVGDGWDVHRLDSAGETVLDRGSAIGRYSLALAGSTLYWTNAGTARSAPIK
jgi:hypothetical protein